MGRFINLWNRIFPLPKVKDEAASQFSQAQLDLLYAHSQAEYYASMVQMLRSRVARLEEAAK